MLRVLQRSSSSLFHRGFSTKNTVVSKSFDFPSAFGSVFVTNTCGAVAPSIPVEISPEWVENLTIEAHTENSTNATLEDLGISINKEDDSLNIALCNNIVSSVVIKLPQKTSVTCKDLHSAVIKDKLEGDLSLCNIRTGVVANVLRGSSITIKDTPSINAKSIEASHSLYLSGTNAINVKKLMTSSSSSSFIVKDFEDANIDAIYSPSLVLDSCNNVNVSSTLDGDLLVSNVKSSCVINSIGKASTLNVKTTHPSLNIDAHMACESASVNINAPNSSNVSLTITTTNDTTAMKYKHNGEDKVLNKTEDSAVINAPSSKFSSGKVNRRLFYHKNNYDNTNGGTIDIKSQNLDISFISWMDKVKSKFL